MCHGHICIGAWFDHYSGLFTLGKYFQTASRVATEPIDTFIQLKIASDSTTRVMSMGLIIFSMMNFGLAWFERFSTCWHHHCEFICAPDLMNRR